MADRYYSWDAYIDLNERLVAKVAESDWQFDSILCLSRGGMRPGDFFSRVYDMPLAILATSSYHEKAGTVQSDLDIAECITGVSELSGKVLLVDDMVDSGKTTRSIRLSRTTTCPTGTSNISRTIPGSTSLSSATTLSVRRS